MIIHNHLDFFENSCAKVTYFKYKVTSPRIANVKNCWNLRIYVLFRAEVKFIRKVVVKWNFCNKNGSSNRVQKVKRDLGATVTVKFWQNITWNHLETGGKYEKVLKKIKISIREVSNMKIWAQTKSQLKFPFNPC